MKTYKKQFMKSALVLFLFMIISACGSKETSTNNETKADVAKPSVTIHAAAFLGNAKEMKAHIAAKSDLNAKDEYGSTALNIAATFGKIEIAQLLIEAGADLDVQMADGSTALHTASFLCRKEMVQALLDKGAKLDIKNNFGSTALESLEVPFEMVKPAYDELGRSLGPFGLKLNYEYLEQARPEVAEMIKSAEQ